MVVVGVRHELLNIRQEVTRRIMAEIARFTLDADAAAAQRA